jgi:hypothetical protein
VIAQGATCFKDVTILRNCGICASDLEHVVAELARRSFARSTSGVGSGARMGCALRAISARAYPTHPEETQLVWYRPL